MKTMLHFFVRSLCLSLLLTTGFSLHAATYYFSASGGDDGRSSAESQNPATPWRSLAKLNSIFSILRPGDNILFKRGDVFQGTISVSSSGSGSASIVFGAYGSGEKPVITGLQTFSNWTRTGNNIWEADASNAGSEMKVVLVNGKFQPIGRYPNSGYQTVESYNANTSITSTALGAGSNWAGGEVIIRKNRWILDRNQITGHSGNTIYYKSGSGYHATAGFGFFIQNHPGTLDQSGEWYFRNKRLGIYATGSPAPSSVQGSVVPVLVSVSGQSNLVFSGLSFNGANENAFEIRNANNVSIVDCSVLYSGNAAFLVSGTDDLRIEGSTIDYSNNLALNVTGSNAIVRNNNISHSGAVAGMGESGDGTYSALLITGNNNLVEGNTIEQTGYVPISFNGSSVTIKNNFIKDFTLVKDDGGGIYTWNNSSNAPTYTNRKVTGNIVLNGHSATEGTKEGDKKFSHGIYIDDNAANVEVTENTVANCEGYGLYIHNARQNKILQNTFYNNTVQIAMVRDDIAPNSPINNTEVRGNVFFSLQPSQMVAEYKTNWDDIASFGNFDQNFYSRPFDDNAVIGVLKRVSGNYSYQQTDVAGWQAMYGKDPASKASPRTFQPYTITSVNGGNKFSNGSFAANANGLYGFSPANDCQTKWSGNALDGGSLAVSFTSTAANSKGTVVIGVGAITAGKKYLLRFSLRGGNEHKMLDVYLRKSGAPYNDVTERRLVKINAARKEVELLFTATESTGDGSIGIDVPEQNSTVYLDNIDLREVSASDVNESDLIKFAYNASESATAVSLGGKFMDVKASVYDGSISLSPYSSAVLLKAGNAPVSEAAEKPVETACSATGSILREQWINVDGNDVPNIPLQLAPSKSDQLTSFEVSPDKGDRYGTRIRGYICPPQSGTYTFWIAGDDATELWLSDSDNPSGKIRIAYNLSWTYFREWNKFSSQKSAAINLVAGKKYFIEALHKEGAGGDHLSVAWQLPDGSMEAPIAGSRLSPYNSNGVMTAKMATGQQGNKQSLQLFVPGRAADGVNITAFPNPFSDNTVIEVTPTQTGPATVDVQDFSGATVLQLYKGMLQKGVTQRYPLQGAKLSSGVYVIRLVSGKNSSFYKILLTK